MNMKILFAPNWRVNTIEQDSLDYQPPDKYVLNQKYWFFKYWPHAEVDISDTINNRFFSFLEKTVHVNIFTQFKTLLRMKQYDIVFFHGAGVAIILMFLFALFKRNKPKIILFDIGNFSSGIFSRSLFHRFIQYSIKSVDLIIYHATIQETFYNKMNCSYKTHFVHFGIDPDFFKPVDNSINVPEKGHYILSFGMKYRDYDTLFDAVNNLGIPIKIIGDINTISKDIPKNVSFNDEKVNINELLRLISDSLFIVLPICNTTFATGQMSLLQSMSEKKLVIVSNVHGIRDYLDEETVLIYESGNSYELKEKILEAVNNNDLRTMIESRARDEVVNNYTEEIMASAIYDAMIERGIVNENI